MVFVIAAALLIGVASLFIGFLSGRRKLPMLYGLLCLLFTGYVCYPLTMTLTRGSVSLYAVESISFCAMLLVVIAMQDRTEWKQRREKDRRSQLNLIVRYCVLGFGALVCLTALVMPFTLPNAELSLMMAYSNLITSYQWIAAGYITFIAGQTVWRKTAEGTPLLWKPLEKGLVSQM